jgi:hypothetical protein
MKRLLNAIVTLQLLLTSVGHAASTAEPYVGNMTVSGATQASSDTSIGLFETGLTTHVDDYACSIAEARQWIMTLSAELAETKATIQAITKAPKQARIIDRHAVGEFCRSLDEFIAAFDGFDLDSGIIINALPLALNLKEARATLLEDVKDMGFYHALASASSATVPIPKRFALDAAGVWYENEWPNFLQACLEKGLDADVAKATDGIIQLARFHIRRTPTATMVGGLVSIAWESGPHYMGIDFDEQGGVEWFHSYGRGNADYDGGEGNGWLQHTSHFA